VAIAAQYGAGQTLQAIAGKHGLSHQRIHQIMKHAGIPLQKLKKRRAACPISPA
jgi:DNA-directed RNA polymerase sigma subunit (sigma70/sigma32)